MIDDIRPPERPQQPPETPSQAPTPIDAPPQPVDSQPPEKTPPPEQKRRWFTRKRLFIALVTLLLVIVVAIGAAIGWYKTQLRPVADDPKADHVRIKIEPGTTPAMIGQQLRDTQLIRSTRIFALYTRFHRVQNSLQAGAYNLSPAQTLPDIVSDLTSGTVDEFQVTFLPGATLAENRQVLVKAGYSADDVDAALAKSYDHPLLDSKPAEANLEGYIYGETYKFPANATLDDILTRTFDEYYQQIQANKLVAAYEKQDLSLFEGITLASIIQREVRSEADEKQVAQVFFKRLKEGTVLGSDVTYKYAAKRFNLVDSPSQDSKYNTRKVKGLPPGPIAVPGLSALLAVAHPASGDFEYFLAGDDGKTYFSRTKAEHEKNIRDHCKINCAE